MLGPDGPGAGRKAAMTAAASLLLPPPRVIMEDLSLPHQIMLCATGRGQIAVTCNCLSRRHRSWYTVIEARHLFPAAEAVAAWRDWHEQRGITV